MDDSLAHLPGKTVKLIRSASEAARHALADRHRATLVIGAAVRPDRPDRARHPDLLLIVEALPLASMRALADAMRRFTRKGLRFRTVKVDELRPSLDVYALEVAEWISHHIVIDGEDLLTELRPAPGHLRHELERSVRGIDRRVRNRVLQGMAVGTRDLARVLEDEMNELLIAAHHTLALVGQQPPERDRKLLEAFLSWLELAPGSSLELFDRLRAGEINRDPLAELESLTDLLDAACRKIDEIEVSS